MSLFRFVTKSEKNLDIDFYVIFASSAKNLLGLASQFVGARSWIFLFQLFWIRIVLSLRYLRIRGFVCSHNSFHFVKISKAMHSYLMMVKLFGCECHNTDSKDTLLFARRFSSAIFGRRLFCLDVPFLFGCELSPLFSP